MELLLSPRERACIAIKIGEFGVATSILRECENSLDTNYLRYLAITTRSFLFQYTVLRNEHEKFLMLDDIAQWKAKNTLKQHYQNVLDCYEDISYIADRCRVELPEAVHARGEQLRTYLCDRI